MPRLKRGCSMRSRSGRPRGRSASRCRFSHLRPPAVGDDQRPVVRCPTARRGSRPRSGRAAAASGGPGTSAPRWESAVADRIEHALRLREPEGVPRRRAPSAPRRAYDRDRGVLADPDRESLAAAAPPARTLARAPPRAAAAARQGTAVPVDIGGPGSSAVHDQRHPRLQPPGPEAQRQAERRLPWRTRTRTARGRESTATRRPRRSASPARCSRRGDARSGRSREPPGASSRRKAGRTAMTRTGTATVVERRPVGGGHADEVPAGAQPRDGPRRSAPEVAAAVLPAEARRPALALGLEPRSAPARTRWPRTGESTSRPEPRRRSWRAPSGPRRR